jgi:hypothetical protein
VSVPFPAYRKDASLSIVLRTQKLNFRGEKELQSQRYISGENEESSLLEQIKDAHQIKSSILPANLQDI